MSSLRDPFWTSIPQTPRPDPQKNEHRLYTKWRSRAKYAKIVSQFCIGIGLVLLLLIKLLCSLIGWHCAGPRIQHLVGLKTLELVANALEYSAGIELAYTLFTEGPDEAVEPVIMGLAAAMLLWISKVDAINALAACASLVFVIALAGLFLIRHYFVRPEQDDQPTIKQPGIGKR
jgi:hypothetical protein